MSRSGNRELYLFNCGSNDAAIFSFGDQDREEPGDKADPPKANMNGDQLRSDRRITNQRLELVGGYDHARIENQNQQQQVGGSALGPPPFPRSTMFPTNAINGTTTPAMISGRDFTLGLRRSSTRPVRVTRRSASPAALPSAAADHRDIVRDPAVIGHAFALARAFGDRRRPEADLSKFSKPLVLQPSSVSSALPLQAAGTAGTEPNQAARSPCSFGLQRVLHPHVGAVRVRRVGVHHRGVGPAGGAFLGNRRGDRAASRPSSRLTWNGQEPEATTPSFLKSSIWTVASCQ